jgi:hypothetical protein
MASPIIVPLSTSIPLINGPLRSIELRPAGRQVHALMAAARVGDSFPPEAVIRFGARLSGRSELTLRRLGADDMAAIESALQILFKGSERRLRVSNAIHAQAKLEALDVESD